ncbi:hypothetical protein AB0C86_12680 [Streptomyces lavendulae]|uniref:hypothetical protein n=1 Tax=Streptomyces lavendulae TaxID=1914 RepID=UPI0033CC0065
MRRHAKTTTASHFFTIALAGYAMVGCSAAGDHISPETKGSEQIHSPSDQRRKLPLEMYTFSSAEELTIARARIKATAACMRKFGLTYQGPPLENISKFPAVTDRRYGLTDENYAALNGYHIAGLQPEKTPSRTPEEDIFLLGENGGASSRNGKEIPPGGCARWGWNKISQENSMDDERLAVELMHKSFSLSQSDPDTKAAISSWSNCMKRSGYSYGDPLTAGDDVSGKNEATSGEREVAKIDARCNNETNLAQTWYAIEKRIQNSLITENGAALNKWLNEKNNILRNAEAVSNGTIPIS